MARFASCPCAHQWQVAKILVRFIVQWLCVAGRVLVVDEADKAPTEVVCVLKGLLEDGEILLGDGRRFVTSRSDLYKFTHTKNDDIDTKAYNIHPVHEDFRIFALANRYV